MTLPDGWRFRANWRGKLILQRRFNSYYCGLGAYIYPDFDIVWRDADVEDLRVLFEEAGK